MTDGVRLARAGRPPQEQSPGQVPARGDEGLAVAGRSEHVPLDPLEHALGEHHPGGVGLGPLGEDDPAGAHRGHPERDHLAPVDVELVHATAQLGQELRGRVGIRGDGLDGQDGVVAVLVPPDEQAQGAGGQADEQHREVEAGEGGRGTDGGVRVLGRAHGPHRPGQQIAHAEHGEPLARAGDAERAGRPAGLAEGRLDRELEVRQLPRLELLGEHAVAIGVRPEVLADERADRPARPRGVGEEALDEPREVVAERALARVRQSSVHPRGLYVRAGASRGVRP